MNRTHNVMLRSARMIFLIVLVLLSSGCEKKGRGEAEFEQAARVVETMLEPKNIKATVFVSLCPEKKPSDFIEFLFTAYAAALWPPSKSEGEDVYHAYRGPKITR